MGSVLEMTDRTDSEYELLGYAVSQTASGRCDSLESVRYLLDCQADASELGRHALQAVGNYDILFDMLEAPACSQCDYYLVAFKESLSSFSQCGICKGKEVFCGIACK